MKAFRHSLLAVLFATWAVLFILGGDRPAAEPPKASPTTVAAREPAGATDACGYQVIKALAPLAGGAVP